MARCSRLQRRVSARWTLAASIDRWHWARVLSGGGLWLALASWRLGSVPGMSLDEAWSILSARGQWPPDNALSGMTSYAGPFPVLLLEAFGTAQGLWVLRGASVAANAATLILVALMLRRLHPSRTLAGWALPLLATSPVWLVVLRTGIEVVIFTPLLFALGLYACMRGGRRAAFVAGLSWGLLIYNHVVGVCFPIGFGLAWLVVYRRRPRIALGPASLGGFLGLAPRLLALVLDDDPALGGSAASHSLVAALADLRWLPLALWRTWQGEAGYLRYVGKLAVGVWPYCLLGLLLFVPWARRMAKVPSHAWFPLLAAASTSVLVAVLAPYLAVRFFLIPILALVAGFVLLGAAAIDRDERWLWPVRATALLLVLGNVSYVLGDFLLPWRAGALQLSTFFFGERASATNSWIYLPKEALARDLVALSPMPEQVLTVTSLERPLRVLLEHTPIAVRLPAAAVHGLRSVFVDYEIGQSRGPYCVPAPFGQACFREPTAIAEWYRIYR